MARLNAAWLVIRMAKFTKSRMHLALSVILEALAQHYLKECQGIEGANADTNNKYALPSLCN